MSDPFPEWINYNGKFYPAASQVLTVSNRGLRYGDGLFETVLVQDGRIRLEDMHFNRLFDGMRILGFEWPPTITPEDWKQQILELCLRNSHSVLARVRLTVFRGEGQLFDSTDNFPHYVIESVALGPEQISFNKAGLRIGVFPGGRKACDPLANLKSGNFLLYSQAARYARDHGWEDCLVLNSHEWVADSCIANLFYIREGMIYTPPLSEGCIAGVMRRFLLKRMPAWGYAIHEQPVSVADLADADEIFLTNAVRTIRWVSEVDGRGVGRSETKVSPCRAARELYELVAKEA